MSRVILWEERDWAALLILSGLSIAFAVLLFAVWQELNTLNDLNRAMIEYQREIVEYCRR